MKRVVKIVGVILALLMVGVAGGFLFLLYSGPAKQDFAALEQPRIVEKKNVKSIKIDFNGDPNVVLPAAFGKLFNVYYQMEGVPKWIGQPAPLARYENFNDLLLGRVSQDELKEMPWQGFVALQVPDSVTSLPAEAKNGPYPLRLETLEYGPVAEIVYYGPYEAEGPAIEKLLHHISEQGYEIAGLHEEEYFKGPGLPFVDPKDYITVIRYQVRKK